MLDVLAELDLSAIESTIQAKDPRGTRPYSPRMMVGLLIYGYCLGVRSSRKLERLTYEDIAFRVLAGGQHPDHSRISAFRREHLGAFQDLFVQVLRLCEKAGLVRLGQVSIDGTKIQGNASKHKAMSYARMVEHEERLLREIEALVEQAEEVDREEDERFGVGQGDDEVPEELRRREDRLKRIREAKAALEAEARDSRAQALREQADRAQQTAASSPDSTVAKRSRTRARRLSEQAEKLEAAEDESPVDPKALPRHRVRALPGGAPHPKAQRNFTDPDSRILESGGAFLQGYNCQAAVDSTAQVIVAADLTNQAPDNGNLLPLLEQVEENCRRLPSVALADSGYWSPEAAARCELSQIDLYIATGRERKSDSPPEPSASDPHDPKAAMRQKLQTTEGRAHYARRKATVEPVFGQIKEARAIRRFLLRGIEAVAAEWQLICCTHNLLKLLGHRATLAA